MTEETAGTPSVLIAGAPDLLEYLPGKRRMGAPDNISAIIRNLEREVAALTAEREVEQPYRTYLYWKDRAEAAEAELDAAKRALAVAEETMRQRCMSAIDCILHDDETARGLELAEAAIRALAAKSTEQGKS